MKKTWKRWLGTVAAALVTSTVLAQSPDGSGVATMRGQSPSYAEEGSFREGQASASARGDRTQQAQYAPSVDAGDVFEDALRGDGYYAENGGVGFASTERLSDIRWRVGNQSLNAPGYDGGYTNINAFVPLSTDGSNSLLFLNPRVNMTDYREAGVNLGLGYRFYDPSDDRVYGVSGWWDYDGGHRAKYNQMGVSLESLGRFFSTRFNANLPMSDSENFAAANPFGASFFQNNNIGYQFNFLRENSYQNYQLELATPLPGFGRYGAEFGLGGYGLVSNSTGAGNASGVSTRLELQVSEDFWINTTLTHDSIFGTNTSINLELTIPNGMQKRWLRPDRAHDKLMASVRRPYRVMVATKALQETRLFRDPKDGTPIQVAHIDPTAANGVAAGSVLNPFGSVQDYMNLGAPARTGFDMIYVGRNLLSTDDTDLNTGIELLDCQRLLGTGSLADGSVHQFQTLDRGDGITVFNLPEFGNSPLQSTGANPFLTNSAAVAGTPVVSINGNITEVSGFNIDASGTVPGVGADGIQSTQPVGVDGFVVTNNTFQNAINAVNIVSNTSPVLGVTTTLPPSRSAGENNGIVTSNTINGIDPITTLPGNVTNGIVINHTAGTGAQALDLLVGSNTIDGVTDFGIDVRATGGSQISGDAVGFGLQSNMIDQTGQGIRAQSIGAGSVFDLTVRGNIITNSTDPVVPGSPQLGAGMGFRAATGGVFNFNLVSENSVTNAGGVGGRGAAFVTTAGSTMTFAPTVLGDPVFLNNTFSNNADDGLLFSATGAGSVISLSDLTTNTFSNNGASGVDFMAQVGGTINTTGPLVGNTITGNTEDGISGTATGIGSLINISIGNSTLDPITGLLQPTLVNTITGNTLNGIDLLATNGATVQGSVQNNTISDNGLNGILISATEPGSLADFNNSASGRLISDNTINGNTAAGVSILVDNTGALPGGGAQALFLRNTISGAVGNPQEFGIQVLGLRTGDLNIDIGDADPLNANTVTGNSDANIAVSLAGSSTADVVIRNNIITNAVNGPNVDFGGDGVVFRTTDTARLFNAQVIDNVITGNADDGIRVLANAASQVHATGNPLLPGLLVTGNTITGNLGDGIQIQRAGDAIIRSIIGTTGGVGLDPVLGNIINGNANHGINVVTGGGAAFPAGVSTDITVGQNTISGNGTTTVGNGVNVVTNADSQTSVDLISNVIQGLGTQDNGVSVLTNNASRFGKPLLASSLFDGNIIIGHTADGISLTSSAISQLDVSIFGTTQQAQIGSNGGNGISINDISGGAVMDINIGDPTSTAIATIGADVSPDAPNVVIFQNINDAIRVNQSGAATINLDVNNTLASGNRVTGGASRHGLSYNSDGQVTNGNANITVDNSTFVDFGGDGMNMRYDHGFINPGANRLVVNVTDSVIGQTQFSTNVGDGVDLEVHDNGARFNFDNNLIQNNGGDGFRLVLLAESMDTARFGIFPDRDANGDGTPETVTPNNFGLPAGATMWGDPNFVDFTTNMSLTNNLIRFNGLDGVDLAIGAGTRLGTAGNRAIVRGNTMTGNALNGFTTRTITNALVAPPTDSVNNGENLADIIRLDPMAFLFLAFGDNVQPNITTQLNPTVTGGVIVAADAIKASGNRDIITSFNVNTNNLNNTINAGIPVSTLGTFFNGWSTFTSTLDAGVPPGIYFQAINTGTIINVP